jgi:putative ABC transport system substrate-binding protein
VDGQSIYIDRRYAAGNETTLRQLISDIIKLPTDLLIISGSVEGALAARQLSGSIPIVVIGIPHPVEAGLVSNLVRPGGNLTVLSADAPGISARSVELLRDTVPQLKRIAVLVNTSGSRPQSVAKWDEMRSAAEGAGIQAESIELRAVDDAEQALATAASHGSDAVFDAFAALTSMDPSIYAALALRRRLPIMTTITESVQSGFLMAYGPNFPSIYRRAAAYVDKILRGANAGDLPVEQPTVFDFAMNLKTAQALGLTIPADVAAQVTQWIQ